MAGVRDDAISGIRSLERNRETFKEGAPAQSGHRLCNRPNGASSREGRPPVTDASRHAVSAGQTSAKILQTLFKSNVEIHSCSGLHAKLVVLDDIAIASSGNLSSNSIDRRLIGAGIITDHPTTVSSAIGFIEDLRKKTPALKLRQIRSLLAIPVTAQGFRPNSSNFKHRTSTSSQASVWLAHRYEFPLAEGDEAEAEAGREEAKKLLANSGADVEYVFYGLNDKLAKEVKDVDSIIWIARPNKDSNRSTYVYPHCPVRSIKIGTRYCFIYYKFGPKAKAQGIRWGDFKNLCVQVGLTRVTRNSERRLREKYSLVLQELWPKPVNRKKSC